MIKTISETSIHSFRAFLKENEKSEATVEKYIRDIRRFLEFIGVKALDKSLILSYKKFLSENYSISSANSMLAALNCFFKFLGENQFCIKQFKVQRKSFCSEEKELTKEEYFRLVNAAKSKGNNRLNLIMQTICSTGIRVSELQFITVEAVLISEAEVKLKGKSRKVFINTAIQKKLKAYIKEEGIKSGSVFITKNGTPMNRSNIWREMKRLCERAGVSPTKVFPHNLRHLFARTFYGIEKDIVKLADVLGHSSINTTRIYIITSGIEHKRKIENMKLVI